MTSQAQQAPPHRGRSPLTLTIIVLAIIVAIVMGAATVWTEILWYSQLDFFQILKTEWLSRALLFGVGFLIMALPLWISLTVAFRTREIYPPTSPQAQNLARYQSQIEPLRKVLTYGLPVLLGLFSGSTFSAHWREFQLWLNRESFGTADPQHGIDVGFYIFTLPVLTTLVSALLGAFLVALVAGAVTHYIYGGVQLRGRNTTFSKPAQRQIGIGAFLVLLLIGVNYWLQRYTLMNQTGAVFDGPSNTDINALLPAKGILAGVAVFVALLFLFAAFRGTWRLPAIGVGLMVFSAIIIGTAYPSIVQRFQVDPNAQTAEAPYIQRNIDATLEAYGLQDFEVIPYDAKTEAESQALRHDAETTASIRLLDPAIVSPSFRQLEQIRQYYDFADVLAVDRYDIEGESRDTVIAVRELNLAGLSADQRTWVNDTHVYTHGYGVVAAFGNMTAPGGQPAFFESGISSTGELGDYEPRIYFGQMSPEYSIVGAPEGVEPWEFDYPGDNESSASGENYTYTGDGGPKIGNFWNRLLFSIKFRTEKILFSDRVNEESQILYDRNPHTRVQKVAPFLTLDKKAYPAIVDGENEGDPGRVVWIIDGYTTSNNYPYSAHRAMDEATLDILAGRTQVLGAPNFVPEQINYIRNSVKAVVDAYTGEVTLYAWDEEDPILQAWSNVFEDTITPLSEMDGSLMSHMRYPEDLFKVQRNLLEQYHVKDAAAFYSGTDFWRAPTDPSAQDARVLQPPFYLTLKMPKQDEPVFSLTSVYIPGGENPRNVLTGYLAVDSETGSEPGKIREGYGKIRLLELPRNSTVPGPGQVKNVFDSEPSIQPTLNLLRQGNSDLINGNLLTLPVGGGLLYVQPVYVQSTSGTQYPLLRKVLVVFGESVGFADTLQEALDQVFGGDAGTDLEQEVETGVGTEPGDIEDSVGETDPGESDADSGDTETVTDADSGETDAGTVTPPPSSGDPRVNLEAALQDARQALLDGQEALADGDFAKYGEAQERLADAIERAEAAEALLR